MQNFLLPRLDFVHYTNLWRQRNTSTLESLAWCHRFLALAKSCGYRKGSVCGERGGQGSLQHYECGASIVLAVSEKKKITVLRFGEGITFFGLATLYFNPCHNRSCNLGVLGNLLLSYDSGGRFDLADSHNTTKMTCVYSSFSSC